MPSYEEVLLSGYTDGYEDGYDYYPCPKRMYLTIEALEDGSIKIRNTVMYSINDGPWQSAVSGDTIVVQEGDITKFKGVNAGFQTFAATTLKCITYGNIMSLVYGDEYQGKVEIPEISGFSNCFSGCLNLVDASDLILPATALTDNCYEGMFHSCFSLETAPKLPATIMKNACYAGMFNDCRSLVTPPSLPANELEWSCYSGMFNGCISLTSTPELPLTDLSPACYREMFKGCTSLTTAPALPATTLSIDCYHSMFEGCTSLVNAPVLPATDLYVPNWWNPTGVYDSMFKGCTSLVNAPALPATNLIGECYKSMFEGCTSLVTAPVLPATQIQSGSYIKMFYGCTSLKYIECYAENPENGVAAWVYNVASAGTFVHPCGVEWEKDSEDGIPSGWEEIDGCPHYDRDYLTFEIKTGGTINFTRHATTSSSTIYYSTDSGRTWNTMTSVPETTINVSAGDKIMFKGDNSHYGSGINGAVGCFSGSTAVFEVCGNIMSLIDSQDFVSATTLDDEYTFTLLFAGCTGLTDASNLILPATTLARGCYVNMFEGCTSLQTAPELPATAITEWSYSGMFKGCTSLTTPPELPATELSEACYYEMFMGCTNLSRTPYELPATVLDRLCYTRMFCGCSRIGSVELVAEVLVDDCYYEMFSGCTSLLMVWCYATQDQGEWCTYKWLDGVASSGYFFKASGMEWESGASGIPQNWTVIEV